MRQHVTHKGIDWFRVKPEHFDDLERRVMEGNRYEDDREPIGFDHFTGTNEYRSLGGHIVSVSGARNALQSLAASWSSHPALLDGLSTKRSEVFAAHVRTS